MEKAVDQKLNTILTSIENNQSITNSWAKIAIPNIQKEQEQQQETTTIQLQKQAIEQTLKPASKLASKPTQKQVQKQAQKQNHESYQARRLFLHVKTEIWRNFNSYTLRNQINDAFQQKENIINSVIASVTRSKTGFSVILTTMPEYNADFLLEKQQI